MAGVTERATERVRDVPAYRPGRPSPGPRPGSSRPTRRLWARRPRCGPLSRRRWRQSTATPSSLALDALARYVGFGPEQLIMTNGSDELCYLVANLLLGPGRVAVMGEPCYQIDATASLLAGASLRRVPLLADGGHDLEAMAKACVGASVVWLPSPHNPTGAACDPAELADFIAQVPEDCLIVLDEAYRAFSDPELRPDVPGLLASRPNLLVQRTLSKDWALAGLRVGYGLAAPALVEALSRARPPFSVNSVALAAIEAGAASEQWRAMSVAMVRQERSRLERALGTLGPVLPEPGQLRHRPAGPRSARSGSGGVRDGRAARGRPRYPGVGARLDRVASANGDIARRPLRRARAGHHIRHPRDRDNELGQ